jgi:DNA-binding beta-propeller fold protein YncE
MSLTAIALFQRTVGNPGKVSAQELQAPTSCEAPPVPNPLAVGVLRWYNRNQAARFPVTGNVTAMTFDGANLYLLGGGAGIVKLRASDGAKIGEFSDFGTLEISGLPGGMIFDGENLWAAVAASDASWVKIRANDGAFQASGGGPPSGLPEALAFDGQSVWIAAGGAGIIKIRASNAQTMATIPSPDATGIAFDGNNIWVADGSGVVMQRRSADGSLVKTFTLGGQPFAVAFDGANVWVTNVGNNTVTKIRTHDGVVLGTFFTQSSPQSIVFDGANMWIGNVGSSSLTKLRACDGALTGTFAAGGRPTTLAFDGINVWLPSGNGTVAKF